MTTVSTNEHHPTAWYEDMSSTEKTTFWACIGGWILDAMDVQMFSFAIPAIIAAIDPRLLVTIVTERMAWGSANSYWIQAVWPAGGMGSLVDPP